VCGSVRPSMLTSQPLSPMDWRTWAIRGSQPVPAERKANWRATLKAILAYALLSVIVSLVLGIVTLVYGVSIVLPDIMDTWGGWVLFIVVPVIIPLVVLSGHALAAYYLLLIGAIVASCTWVFMTSYGGFLKELTMKAKSREHSALFDITGFVTVNVFVSFVILFIATMLGAGDTEAPDLGTTSEALFALANASVWEELIVRVLLLGLPLVVVDLVRRRRDRKWYRYVLGGSLEIGPAEVALIIASSTIFGFAHYDGGWGSWKIVDAGIGGLMFGYLFLKFGLASAIVLHFAIDYTGMPGMVFGLSEAYEMFLVLLWLAVGAVLFVYYLTRIWEFLTGAKVLDERPRHAGVPWPQPTAYSFPTGPQHQPPPPPAASPTPTDAGRTLPPPPPETSHLNFVGGYVCPTCGGTEARYINGRFECVRCGKLT